MIGEVVAVIVAVVTICIVLDHLKKPKNMPPSPPPLPLLGNMLQLLRWMSKNQVQIEFAKAAKQYGDVFMLDIPGDRTVVINSASIARNAVLTKKDDFSGRPHKFTWDYMTRGSKDIFIGDFSQTLILQRKLVHSAIRKYNPRLEKTINKEMCALSDRLRSYQGKPVDPARDIFLTTLNVILAMVFGQRYEVDDPEFLTIVDYHEKMTRLLSPVGLLNIFPFLFNLPIKESRELEQVRQTRDMLMGGKLAEHRETFQDGTIRDLTDALIKAMEEAKEEDNKAYGLMTEDHVLLTMCDIITGGLETTSSTILWFMVYMMRHPDVQARAHAQLDDVIGRDFMPRYEDRERLPYLEAVVVETLRMSCVGALAMPHRTTKDTTLEGYDIPKDTTVLLNLWAMHYNDAEWEHPDKFNPARFLDAEGRFTSASGFKSYLAFSAGRRGCVGEALAKQELFIVISRLLHQFVFENPTGSPLPRIVGNMVAVHQSKPFQVCIRARK